MKDPKIAGAEPGLDGTVSAPATLIDDIKARVVGPLSLLECRKLADVAAGVSCASALEVGHYLGLSTSVLLASLPLDVELVTIDHHQGDAWCPGTSFDEFWTNVAPYVGARDFDPINAAMVDALPTLGGTFGFVFYDADHTASAVAEFWDLAADLLEPDCVLVFDDADWAEQSTLRGLAAAAGFQVVTDAPFWRGEHDKHDPDTYTLEVMVRRA